MYLTLPLIYEPSKSQEVLAKSEKFFELFTDKHKELHDACWLYQTLGKSIPQDSSNFWSGHYFPYSESWDEIQISCNLAFSGLYKQAFVSLRSALELGMLSIYYNINDEGHKEVANWLDSKNTPDASTPRAEKIWKILLSNPNIRHFDIKFNLQGQFNALSFLHNYVHTKGYEYSNQIGRPKSNCQTFEEDVLLQWMETLFSVMKIVTTLHLLKYPIATIEYDWFKKFGIDIPSFGGLQISEVQRIKMFLPVGHFQEIQNLANTDSATRKTLQEIIGLKDMDEQEIEAQAIRIEKFSIQHGEGFLEWEKQQLGIMDQFNFDEQSRATVRQRIEALRVWAVENNFMDSKGERLKQQGLI